jgi:hypothetical protein
MERPAKIAFLCVGGALFIGGLLLISRKITRGYRNNNPGNIRISDSAWIGKIGNDGTFEQFSEMWQGVRAIAKIILKYQSTYGLTTLRELGDKYAPASDNDGADYGAGLATTLSIDEDDDIDFSTNLQNIIHAIVINENSMDLITSDEYTEAIQSARTT